MGYNGKRAKNGQGFTLIELVLVIVILGILAIAALPSFVDISQNAANSARDGVAGAVREGINIYRTNNLVNSGPPGCFPTALDSASNAAASLSNRLFATVITNGIDDSSWTKTNSTSYYYNKGNVSTTFTYSATDGSFVLGTATTSTTTTTASTTTSSTTTSSTTTSSTSTSSTTTTTTTCKGAWATCTSSSECCNNSCFFFLCVVIG